MNTVPVEFVWKLVTPDHRQWKPSAPQLEPNVKVVVDVPLESKYVYNAEKVSASYLYADVQREMVKLTPAGMRFCVDTLEAAMSEVPSDEEKESEDTKWEDDWEDDDNVTKLKNKAKKTNLKDLYNDEDIPF